MVTFSCQWLKKPKAECLRWEFEEQLSSSVVSLLVVLPSFSVGWCLDSAVWLIRKSSGYAELQCAPRWRPAPSTTLPPASLGGWVPRAPFTAPEVCSRCESVKGGSLFFVEKKVECLRSSHLFGYPFNVYGDLRY